MVRWSRKIPCTGLLVVGADPDDAAGKRADDKSVAVLVVLNVLVARVHPVGDSCQVSAPELATCLKIILDEEVVARNVLALGVEGGSGINDDGEPAEGIYLDAAGVEDRISAKALEFDRIDDGVDIGIPDRYRGVVDGA